MTTAADISRIQKNLTYLAANPVSVTSRWRELAEAEARAAGLLPPQKPVVGINCRPGIDRGIIYGGDRDDVF